MARFKRHSFFDEMQYVKMTTFILSCILLSFGLIKPVDNHAKEKFFEINHSHQGIDENKSIGIIAENITNASVKDGFIRESARHASRITKRSIIQERNSLLQLCDMLFGWLLEFGVDLCDFREKSAPSFSFCPEGGVVPADFGKTSTSYSWTEPVVLGNLDGLVSVTGGYKSGSVFESGKHMVTYTFTDSDSHRAVCQFVFEIKVINCDLIPWQQYGKIMYSTNEFMYGSNVSVTCLPGYEMAPDVITQVITCEALENNMTSYWSFQPKQCRAISCPLNDSAIQSAHGQIKCTNDNELFSFCYTDCEDGYTLESDNAAVCLQNKTWSNTVSDCKDIESPRVTQCPTDFIFSTFNNQSEPVYWKQPMAQDNSNKVLISQIHGPANGSPFPIGRTKVSYNISDETNAVICEFNVFVEDLFCNPLQTKEFLTTKCTDGYRYDSVCHFACKDNFILVGQNYTKCQKNQNTSQPAVSWDNRDPETSCQVNKEDPCPILSSPTNGNMTCVSGIHGVICTLQCSPSYDIPLGRDGLDFNGVFICSFFGGFYYPSNIVPSCTVREKPTAVQTSVSLIYNVDDCSNNTLIEDTENNFIYQMHLLELSEFLGTCSHPLQCYVSNIVVTCGYGSRRRKRATNLMSLKFIVNADLPATNLSNRETYVLLNSGNKNSTESIRTLAKMGNLTVNGYSPSHNISSSEEIKYICPFGRKWQNSSLSCVPCHTGYFPKRTDSTNFECTACPKGEFLSDENDLNCSFCPHGTTTAKTGSRSWEDCKGACEPGMFSTNGILPCSKCPRSTFQRDFASIECNKCPIGKITHVEGSVSETDCTDFDASFQKRGDTIDLPFDMIYNGNTTMISVFLWIKIAEQFNNFTILAIINSSFKLKIIYTDTISLFLDGFEIQTSTYLQADKWQHIGIVLDAYNKTAVIYRNGQKMQNETNVNFPEDYLLVYHESLLRISQNYDNAISITSYILFSGVLSEATIRHLASKCELPLFENNKQIISTIAEGSFDGVVKRLPSSCDNIDHCDPDPCNGHNCLEHGNTFRCQCRSGYFGETCEFKQDFCSMQPCLNEATCKNLQTNFTCLCSEGFKGKTCEQKIRNGGWGEWGRFSECSASCGEGIRYRSRQCINPPPDPEGIPCNASLSQNSEPCNVNTCPSCKELYQPDQTIVNCSNSTDGHIICKVYCRPGYIFFNQHQMLSEYICGSNTSFIWNGMPQACSRGKGPQEMTFITIAKYNNTFPCTKRGIISETLTSNLKDKQCISNGACNLDINFPECANKNQTSSVSTIELKLNISGLDPDINLESYEQNNTRNRAMNDLIKILQEMNNTAHQIKNSSDVLLSFKINGHSYFQPYLNYSPQIKCAENEAFQIGGFLCAVCPPGSHYNSSSCILCRVGSYQDEMGQTFCKACPSGTTTIFTGSQRTSDCSNVVESSSRESLDWSSTVNNIDESSSTESLDTSSEVNIPAHQTQTTTSTALFPELSPDFTVNYSVAVHHTSTSPITTLILDVDESSSTEALDSSSVGINPVQQTTTTSTALLPDIDVTSSKESLDTSYAVNYGDETSSTELLDTSAVGNNGDETSSTELLDTSAVGNNPVQQTTTTSTALVPDHNGRSSTELIVNNPTLIRVYIYTSVGVGIPCIILLVIFVVSIYKRNSRTGKSNISREDPEHIELTEFNINKNSRNSNGVEANRPALTSVQPRNSYQ